MLRSCAARSRARRTEGLRGRPGRGETEPVRRAHRIRLAVRPQVRHPRHVSIRLQRFFEQPDRSRDRRAAVRRRTPGIARSSTSMRNGRMASRSTPVTTGIEAGPTTTSSTARRPRVRAYAVGRFGGGLPVAGLALNARSAESGGCLSLFGRLGRHEWRNRIAAGKGFLERFVLVVAFVALALPAFFFRFLAGGFVLGVFGVLAIATFHGGLRSTWPAKRARHRVNAPIAVDVMRSPWLDGAPAELEVHSASGVQQ